MRSLIRRKAARLAAGVALALGLAVAGLASVAVAQDIKQMKISDKHVSSFIAAQKDLTALGPELQAAGEKIDAKLQAKLEDVAKKHGFANFAELDDVAANISLVMAGLDPQSGNFTDPIEALKQELEEIKKDASIPEKDKKQMVEELNEAIKSTPPLQFKENIDIVKKHRDAIEKALQ